MMFLVKSNRPIVIILFYCVMVVVMFMLFKRTCVQERDNMGVYLERYERNEGTHREHIENKDEPPILNPTSMIKQHGDYWIYYNLLISKRMFAPYESITYTTQGDFTFLDNVQPLLERWKGPMSIALYAPGDDFNYTVESIHYLRDCTTNLIQNFVTFHVFLKGQDLPKEIPNFKKIFNTTYNCNIEPSFKSIKSNETYRALNNLTYPINVARNVAKESSQTYFVLASDIELYPSVNIIQNFLEMINRTQITATNSNPAVFPLNVFEVKEDAEIPKTKTELLEMLKKKKAINFHQKVCPACHRTPNYNEWIKTNETKGINVFYVGKRIGSFKSWEPFFIGSKYAPDFDERLSWEGQSNKMTQGYILCVKDYDMMMLDNAFLVHKPGIKVFRRDPIRRAHVIKTNVLIRKVIRKELETLFGVKKGCRV